MGARHTRPSAATVQQQQRSITPPLAYASTKHSFVKQQQQFVCATELPGMSIVDTASTASSGAAERRRRAQALAERNPTLAFQLPAPAPSTTTIGYIYISGNRLTCSSDAVRDIIWDPTRDGVDRDISEALQLLCETTLRRARGGYQAILQKLAHTYYFVSHYNLASSAANEIRISVRVVVTEHAADAAAAVSVAGSVTRTSHV